MSGATSAIALGASAASMGSGLVGSYYGARSQQSSLQFQSNIARINAGIANTNADTIESIGNANADAILATGDFNASIAELGAQSALEAGQQQIAAQTLKAGQLKGAQRAALAANGIDLGEGSAAEVQVSSDIVKQIDTDTLRANAARTAWGYRAQGMEAQLQAGLQALNTRTQAKVQGINLRTGAGSMEADALLKSGSAAGLSPVGAGFSSLLSGAGDVADSWYRYSQSKG